jgi:hypothetical protein
LIREADTLGVVGHFSKVSQQNLGDRITNPTRFERVTPLPSEGKRLSDWPGRHDGNSPFASRSMTLLLSVI